jgi:hypothetical protein
MSVVCANAGPESASAQQTIQRRIEVLRRDGAPHNARARFALTDRTPSTRRRQCIGAADRRRVAALIATPAAPVYRGATGRRDLPRARMDPRMQNP